MNMYNAIIRYISIIKGITSHKIIGILNGYIGYIGIIVNEITLYFSMARMIYVIRYIMNQINTQGLSIVRKVKEVTKYMISSNQKINNIFYIIIGITPILLIGALPILGLVLSLSSLLLLYNKYNNTYSINICYIIYDIKYFIIRFYYKLFVNININNFIVLALIDKLLEFNINIKSISDKSVIKHYNNNRVIYTGKLEKVIDYKVISDNLIYTSLLISIYNYTDNFVISGYINHGLNLHEDIIIAFSTYGRSDKIIGINDIFFYNKHDYKVLYSINSKYLDKTFMLNGINNKLYKYNKNRERKLKSINKNNNNNIKSFGNLDMIFNIFTYFFMVITNRFFYFYLFYLIFISNFINIILRSVPISLFIIIFIYYFFYYFILYIYLVYLLLDVIINLFIFYYYYHILFSILLLDLIFNLLRYYYYFYILFYILLFIL